MVELTKGMVLGNTYEIVEEIGSGGGGVVYRAKHLRLDTDVVVKKIKDEVKGKLKSRQEADILKRLKHPYLPRVYDFIETDEAVYTVMDFIHGEDMDTAIKRHGKFSQKEVKKWAEQLGEALDYLHSQNPPIIHSDIKPANIMLTEEGNVCLIDFNISLAVGGEMESAVGISAGYSPPEQYKNAMTYAKVTRNYTLQKSLQMNQKKAGYLQDNTEIDDEDKTVVETEIDEDKTLVIEDNTIVNITEDSEFIKYFGKGIDARSDIYSLGVTLCCLLTGEISTPGFEQRNSVERAKQFVSGGFEIILSKMVEFAPEDRYKNGSEYLKAIRNCYKLDRRYVAIHRKQLAIQFAALICIAIGILVSFGGLNKLRIENDVLYIRLLEQAEECITACEYENADKYIEEAKGVKEAGIEAFEKEVFLQYSCGAYEECISLGEEYINTVPFKVTTDADKQIFGDIHYLVANAYYELKDYANAENVLARALEYNQHNALYYRDYAITLAKLGNAEKAGVCLEEAIELGMAQDSVYMTQGEIAYSGRDYQKALEYLSQTIDTTVDVQMKKRAILLCADVYKSIGNDMINEEIDLLEKNRNQFDGNGKLVMSERLAEAYSRKAQVEGEDSDACYRAALVLFEEIYEQGYVTFQLQQNMAILYENMNEFEQAEAIFLRMVEDYPERYEVYKRLAFLEADKQQEKENQNRDYVKMREYYELAKDKYSGEEQDMEMDMLDNMMKELEDGGWF